MRTLSLLTAASIMVASAHAVPRVLVYTATAGYRHDSIPTAIEVLGQQQGSWNVSFDFSEDKSLFTNETLSTYDGVMFVSNSEQVLDDTGTAALKTFFQSGGVYAGVHAASACLYNDTTYLQAVGGELILHWTACTFDMDSVGTPSSCPALFDYHPVIQSATFQRLNTTHPATAELPDNWTFQEEVYNFRSDPRSLGAVVLLTVDSSSYTDNGTSTGDYPSQGSPHPIAWYIESPESAQPLLSGAPKAGRSFYTSLGHLNSTWQNETFIHHVMAGLTWALDGKSTKAFGVGLVGNSTGAATSSSSGGAASTFGSSASSSQSSASTSQAGGGARLGASKLLGLELAAAATLVAVAAGAALIL